MMLTTTTTIVMKAQQQVRGARSLLLLRSRRRPVAFNGGNCRLVTKRNNSTTSRGTTAKDKTVFQEKTDRATQLHTELEDLMQNHHKRLKDDSKRPVYHGLFSFLRRNKGEVINIAAAFVCTMLAYQIVGLRQYSKKLEGQLKEKDDAAREKQSLLLSLATDGFVRQVAGDCTEAISNGTATTASQASSWLFGGKKARDYDDKWTTFIIAHVLGQALTRRIGDAGLSDEQKKDQIMKKLQEAQDELIFQQKQKDDEYMRSMAASLTNENVVEVVEDSSSGDTIVKKRRFAM